jgi:hypothetical protein
VKPKTEEHGYVNPVRDFKGHAHQDFDYVPCSFMSFTILRNRHKQDLYALALAEQEMGLDPMLFIPTLSRGQRRDHPDLRGLPVRFHPDVKTKPGKKATHTPADFQGIRNSCRKLHQYAFG